MKSLLHAVARISAREILRRILAVIRKASAVDCPQDIDTLNSISTITFTCDIM